MSNTNLHTCARSGVGRLSNGPCAACEQEEFARTVFASLAHPTPDTPAPPPSGGTAPDSRTADEDVRNEMREWSAAGAAAFLAFEASLPENDEPAPPTAEPELDEKRMIEQLDALATLAETAGRGGEVARTLRAAHKALTDPNYRHALHEHVRALEARLAEVQRERNDYRRIADGALTSLDTAIAERDAAREALREARSLIECILFPDDFLWDRASAWLAKYQASATLPPTSGARTGEGGAG